MLIVWCAIQRAMSVNVYERVCVAMFFVHWRKTYLDEYFLFTGKTISFMCRFVPFQEVKCSYAVLVC